MHQHQPRHAPSWSKPGVSRALAVIALVCGLPATKAAQDTACFPLGVAAGDVRATSAILWTRADRPGPFRYELATDETFATLAASGTVEATPEDDLILRVVVADLEPATAYVYRFLDAADPACTSRIGHFRTPPAADTPAELRLVFTGDTNIAYAPFGLAGPAAAEHPDLFIWMGDTIYADDPASRVGVARTLAQYREKYREIRRDPYMQSLLASTALWVGWDDHEVENDYAGGVPTTPPAQIEDAYRAFFEYMPVARADTSDDPYREYRSFRWGSSVEFFILDERQYRDVSAEETCGGNLDPLGTILGPLTRRSACVEALSAPRTMLGSRQLDWLEHGLAASTARVKFVVNGVPLGFLGVFPYDRWDGYDHERRELLEFIDANQITGIIFLTTDFHSNWYNPDVAAWFASHRRDYRLPHGVRVVEAVVGPLGMETMRQTLVDFPIAYLNLPNGPVVRGILGWLERMVVRRLKVAGGYAFAQSNRRGYVVIDVTPAGDVRLTYRGAPPEQSNGPDVVPETLFSAEIPAPQTGETENASDAAGGDDHATEGGSGPARSLAAGIPCVFPVLLAGIAAWIPLRLARRRR